MILSSRQNGAALVLAMLIVAMVTAIAVELSWRFDLGITRSGNRWYGMQANAHLEGAEAFAKIVLRTDMEETQVDTLNEDWAREPFGSDTAEGWVQGKLEDAQGRFNLNLMAAKVTPPDNATDAQRFTESQRRFIRLLQTIPIEPDVFLDELTAINIAEAVIDWIDADDEVTGFGGAESDYYSSLDVPYTIANKMMVSVTELRIIKGINQYPKLYEGILPYVIALQPDAKLNVNTASANVLRSLNAKDTLRPLTDEEVQLLVEGRGIEEEGFPDVNSFRDSHAVENVMGKDTNGNSKLDVTDLVVASNYFLFFGETEVGDRIRTSRSVLRRENNDVATLRRTDANF